MIVNFSQSLSGTYTGGDLKSAGIGVVIVSVLIGASVLLRRSRRVRRAHFADWLSLFALVDSLGLGLQMILDKPFLTGKPRIYSWSLAFLIELALALVIVLYAIDYKRKFRTKSG